MDDEWRAKMVRSAQDMPEHNNPYPAQRRKRCEPGKCHAKFGTWPYCYKCGWNTER